MLLEVRALCSSDFPLPQRWLSEPHVDAWWHQALDLSKVASKYGPRIEGTEPTHVYIIDGASGPIGFIQWYRWSDCPQHAVQLGAEQQAAGVDLAIGERSLIGRGIGPQIIREFLEAFVRPQSEITAVVVDVDARNARSWRAFEKGGLFSNSNDPAPRRGLRAARAASQSPLERFFLGSCERYTLRNPRHATAWRDIVAAGPRSIQFALLGRDRSHAALRAIIPYHVVLSRSVIEEELKKSALAGPLGKMYAERWEDDGPEANFVDWLVEGSLAAVGSGEPALREAFTDFVIGPVR